MTNLSWAGLVVCPANITDPLHSGWVYQVFGECVYNLRQYFAFFFGMSSIVFWLFAQVPQLVTNCMYGKADKALSFWFLLQWFAGDATNLIGALLTKQLTTQIATAVYFVIIDTAMMLQFLYYVVRNQGSKGLLNCFKCPRENGVVAVLLPGMMCTLLLVSRPLLWSNPYGTSPRVGRALLQKGLVDGSETVIDLDDVPDFIGYLLGCVSGVLYVSSRVPQIIKNCIRCSVEGLSLPMFILAVLGNVTYGLGIFLYSVDGVFILRKLPWLVGSIGTLCFDFTIVCQFLVTRFCGCGTCGRKRDGGEEEPLLQSAADHGTVPCINKWGSIQQYSRTQTPDNKVQDISTSYYDFPQ